MKERQATLKRKRKESFLAYVGMALLAVLVVGWLLMPYMWGDIEQTEKEECRIKCKNVDRLYRLEATKSYTMKGREISTGPYKCECY